MKRLLAMLLLVCATSTAQAHPLAPALLELRETDPGLFTVQWRTALVRALGRDVVPAMPEGCALTSDINTRDEADARLQRWTLRCPDLVGRSLRVDGLEGSGVNVILRVALREAPMQQVLLDARSPAYTVRPVETLPPVFSAYFALGVEHLLLGLDHVLFVIALLLLVRGTRRRVLTITAFTLGHSLTLGLAALGWVAVDARFTELMIALSLVVLALEILRPATAPSGLFARSPWGVAAGFGLLHGLGFAGALAGVGLPADEIPSALLAFNLGIEAGQLLLIGAWVLAALAWRRLPPPGWRPLPHFPQLARLLPAYAIGSLAAYWCWERAASFI